LSLSSFGSFDKWAICAFWFSGIGSNGTGGLYAFLILKSMKFELVSDYYAWSLLVSCIGANVGILTGPSFGRIKLGVIG
jgi:hypothetical protein